MPEEEQLIRKHAKEISLKGAQGERGRVAVLGTIVSLNRNNLEAIIADEDVHAKLLFAEGKQFDSVNEKDLCRIIGKGFFNNNELTINVEAVHPINGLDLPLWKRVRELEARQKGDRND